MTLPLVALNGDCDVEIKPYQDYTDSDQNCLPDDELGVVNLNCVTGEQAIFKVDRSWVRPLEKGADVYVVVGPPNCGKSTYVGYLMNQLASQPLLYLEADCGQPNFGQLPGTLSLLELDHSESIQPRITKVLKSFFYNAADPAADPYFYLDAVNQLL